MEPTNLDKFYSDKITIWRNVAVRDSYGGMTNTWEKKLWNISCRIYSYRQSMGEYTVTVDGIERLVTHKMNCNKKVDIVMGDKLENANYSETYRVVKVIRVRGFRDIHHIEAHLALTEGENENA